MTGTGHCVSAFHSQLKGHHNAPGWQHNAATVHSRRTCSSLYMLLLLLLLPVGPPATTTYIHSRAFPVVAPDASALACPPADSIQAMWVGHATVLVQLEGVTFITDPLFSQRSSPVQFMGPRR